MLINNEYGTFVILEDKVFHIERGRVLDTGPISKEELKEIKLADYCIIFKKNNLLHRDNDLPAVVYVDGTKYWYQNNNLYLIETLVNQQLLVVSNLFNAVNNKKNI